MSLEQKLERMNEDLEATLQAGDFSAASGILTQMWLMAQISFAKALDPNLKELTYIKTPIEIDNGKYLLVLMHVDGEKFKLGAPSEPKS